MLGWWRPYTTSKLVHALGAGQGQGISCRLGGCLCVHPDNVLSAAGTHKCSPCTGPRLKTPLVGKLAVCTQQNNVGL